MNHLSKAGLNYSAANYNQAVEEVRVLLTMLTGDQQAMDKLSDPYSETKNVVTSSDEVKLPQPQKKTVVGGSTYGMASKNKDKSNMFTQFSFNDVLFSMLSNYIPDKYKDYLYHFHTLENQKTTKREKFIYGQVAKDRQRNDSLKLKAHKTAIYNQLFQFSGRQFTTCEQSSVPNTQNSTMVVSFPEEIVNTIESMINAKLTDRKNTSIYQSIFSGELKQHVKLRKFSEFSRAMAYLNLIQSLQLQDSQMIVHLINDLVNSINPLALEKTSLNERMYFIQAIIRMVNEENRHLVFHSVHERLLNDILQTGQGDRSFLNNVSISFLVEYLKFLLDSKDIQGSFSVLSTLINFRVVFPPQDYILLYLQLLHQKVYLNEKTDNLQKKMLFNLLTGPLSSSKTANNTLSPEVALELSKWLSRPEEIDWFLNYILSFSNSSEIISKQQFKLLENLTSLPLSTIDLDERIVNRTMSRLAKSIRLTCIIDKFEAGKNFEFSLETMKLIVKLYTQYAIYPASARWFVRAGGASSFSSDELENLKELIAQNRAKQNKPEYATVEITSTRVFDRLFKNPYKYTIAKKIYSGEEGFMKLMDSAE